MNELKREIVLPFIIEEQEKSRWCWAAVAVSIAKFYNPNIFITQSQLVDNVFDSENNNHVYEPKKTLELVNHYQSMVEGPLSTEDIYLSLTQGNPIAACMRYFIGWHLVVIYGISTDNQLYIADSQHGYTKLDIEKFTHAYLDDYFWTHSFLLKGI